MQTQRNKKLAEIERVLDSKNSNRIKIHIEGTRKQKLTMGKKQIGGEADCVNLLKFRGMRAAQNQEYNERR